MSYREKYLKYKTKYLKLRQQGGGSDDIIIEITNVDKINKKETVKYYKDSTFVDSADVNGYINIYQDKDMMYNYLNISLHDDCYVDNCDIYTLINNYLATNQKFGRNMTSVFNGFKKNIVPIDIKCHIEKNI